MKEGPLFIEIRDYYTHLSLVLIHVVVVCCGMQLWWQVLKRKHKFGQTLPERAEQIQIAVLFNVMKAELYQKNYELTLNRL